MTETDYIRAVVRDEMQKTPVQEPFIPQHQAWRFIKRYRLDRYIRQGLIGAYKEDLLNPHSRMYVNYEDLMKIYNHKH